MADVTHGGSARPRIAVVGAGVSGLVAAWLLQQRHEVTLFEAEDRPGGHTHTCEVEDPNGRIPVDTGFIIYNERNYPLFSRLLREFGVRTQPTDMSFSVRDDRRGLEWTGSNSPNAIFGQRRNLLNPRFWRMLRDILRFGREATQVLEADQDDRRTVREYARDHGYGEWFVEAYLLPMGASLWSCPARRFAEFPIRFVVEFMQHHALLQMAGRPQWRTLCGGSRTYVDALLARFRGSLQLGCPVERVRRGEEAVTLLCGGREHTFDEVILACHSDQALALLGDADADEREVLGAFPYQANEAILHCDTRVLPRRRRCWGAWNHRHRPDGDDSQVAVTYNMNILQRLPAQRTWCVTLNDDADIDPALVARRIRYAHPLYTDERARAQARHGELTRRRRTSFCGAYWGYGFHEDGVRSAVHVARAFGVEWP